MISLRDARPEAFTDARGPRARRPRGARGHLGLRRRRRPHRGRGRPAGRGGRRRRQGLGGRSTATASSWPPSRSTPTPPGSPTTRSTRSTVPDAEKSALLIELSERLMAADGVEHVQTRVHAREGAEVLRRHGGHPHPPAAGPHPPGVHRADRRPGHRPVREHAHARPAGRPRLGVPDRQRLGLARRARRDPRAAAGEDEGAVGRGRPLRPGRRPVQPVAHHPRVDRARHRARPGARLRGRLRRARRSPPSTSSAPCSTARR